MDLFLSDYADTYNIGPSHYPARAGSVRHLRLVPAWEKPAHLVRN